MSLFCDLAKAIKHIHKHKIIHRDIKPQNIFIDIIDGEKERYVLGDLGIAKFDDNFFPKNVNTKDGERLANINFSAPEQISGKNEDVTFASDIYQKCRKTPSL